MSQDRDFPRTTGVISQQRFDADQVTTTYLGEYELFDWDENREVIIPVYDFKLKLAEPVALEADTKYWFSPLSYSNTLQPLFTWTVSDLVGKSVQIGTGDRFIRNNNATFTLIGLDGDFNRDSVLDVLDVDQLIAQIQIGEPDTEFDMNLDGAVDFLDLETWVHDYKGTWMGDANLDGEFSSGDLVDLFASGQYEDGIPMNSGWSEGDFNADGDFSSGDLVVALADGGFELGPRPAVVAVPEPVGSSLFLLAGLGVAAWNRRPLRRREPARRQATSQIVRVCVVALLGAICAIGAGSRSALAVELIADGSFDNLPVGSAPNNDQPAGGWQFYQLYETDKDNNGRFFDEYQYYENFSDQVSIVATSSFDPTREGNSLRLRGVETSVQLYHLFASPVLEAPNQVIRASFEVYLTDVDAGGTAGTVIIAGDHGGGGATNIWDRGPQLNWDQDGIAAHQCDSVHCGMYTQEKQVDALEQGVWQQVQLDMDLVSDTYDAYWGSNGEPLQLIGNDLRFRAGELEFLDRFNLAFFNDADSLLGNGDFYLDNVSVNVIEMVEPVPEPSTGLLSLFATGFLAIFIRRAKTNPPVEP